MSLTDLRKLDDKGVEFAHIDGTKFMLTPERSVEIQNLSIYDHHGSGRMHRQRGGRSRGGGFNAPVDALGRPVL